MHIFFSPHYFLTPSHTQTTSTELPSVFNQTYNKPTNHKHQAKAMKLVYTVAAVLFAAVPARAGVSLSVSINIYPTLSL
jgi:hypothetical protein